MKTFDTHKVVLASIGKATTPTFSKMMNLLVKILVKLGILRRDLDHHVVRASMVNPGFASVPSVQKSAAADKSN
jgi:hypothetical protein